MAYQVVTRVSKESATFATVEEALDDWKAAVAEKEAETGETIKMKVQGFPSISRTIELLEDGTGFAVTDVYDSEDIYAERMSKVMPGWEAAGITTGDPLDGWVRTVISAGNVE
jgi:hypothetical protein